MAPRWDGIWVLGAVAFAWRGLLHLGPSGEEYALAAQLRAGAAPGHVFRPLADLWIAGLGWTTDLRFAPLGFWLQGFLHGINGVLLLALTRALGLGRAASLTVALLFAVGAGVADSLAWLAAVNRPLSTLGALVALLGALRFARPVREGGGRGWQLLLVGSGFLWQFSANEEVYGTALLLAVWLGLFAPLRATRRLFLAGLPLLAVALHFFALRGSATGAAARMDLGVAQFAAGVLERHEHMGAGLGLGGVSVHLGLGLALFLLLVGRRYRIALFASLWLVAALVPFALDPGGAYRYYPSQAPIALLLGGGLAVLLAPAARHVGPSVWLPVCLLGLWTSEGPRATRVEEWRVATAFVREFDSVLAERPDDAPRALLALDTSVRGVLAARRPGVDAMGVPSLAALDTHLGFVRPGPLPQDVWSGPWIGRTFRGEIAWIDEPERYFGDRVELAPVGLVDRAVCVTGLDAALLALWEPEFDPLRGAVVEVSPEALGDLEPGAMGDVHVLVPLTLDPAAGRAKQRFRVTTSGPMLLVLSEPWSFGELWRFPKDQAVAQGVRERRVLAPRATDGASGEALLSMRANAYGAAVLVPAGEHTVVVEWRLAAPSELR